MGSLDQVIDYTKLFQEIELATAVGQLKQNPAQLQQFLQDQQGKVYNDIIKQKESTFEKVYGDLGRASRSQEAIVKYDKQSKEFADLQKQLYANQKQKSSSIVEDKNLAGRKYEMNEWSVNNKKETLFIYSMLFIVLMTLVLITALLRMGIIGSGFWVAVAGLVIVIFILTVVNRTQFTNVFRNNRYWNRTAFNDKFGKIPVPLCPNVVPDITAGASALAGDISSGVSSAAQDISSGVSSAAQDISSGVSSAAQGISSGVSSAATSTASAVKEDTSDLIYSMTNAS